MNKKLISLAIQGLLGSGGFPMPIVDYGKYHKPLWHESCPVRVTCGEDELRPGVDYTYDLSTGTVHFLRPVNGVINVVSAYQPTDSRRNRVGRNLFGGCLAGLIESTESAILKLNVLSSRKEVARDIFGVE